MIEIDPILGETIPFLQQQRNPTPPQIIKDTRSMSSRIVGPVLIFANIIVAIIVVTFMIEPDHDNWRRHFTYIIYIVYAVTLLAVSFFIALNQGDTPLEFIFIFIAGILISTVLTFPTIAYALSSDPDEFEKNTFMKWWTAASIIILSPLLSFVIGEEDGLL